MQMQIGGDSPGFEGGASDVMLFTTQSCSASYTEIQWLIPFNFLLFLRLGIMLYTFVNFRG
jgi:hypothetical protein